MLLPLEIHLARFEEGVPADPTVNMSEEDAAEWEEMNEEYGDQFKTAAHRLDRQRGHQLVPNSLARKLPAIYSQEGEADPIVWVKLFSPYTGAVWYLTEYDPAEKQAFGWADLGMGGGELGYIAVDQLEGLNKRGLPLVERELYWTPQPLSKAKASRMASQRRAKFPRGEKMTVDEVAAVVGPEFKEMNENPPPEVVALREEMEGKTAGYAKEYLLPIEQAAMQRKAAAGLYGFTKGIQRDAEAAIKKAQRKAATIAKTLYAKDEQTVAFLKTHAKRASSKTAKLILSAMAEIGPKVASDKTAKQMKSGGGLYGHPTKTARMALMACAELRAYMGEVAYDLHSRRNASFDHLTGFFKQHGKTAKCAFSSMLWDCYPEAPEGNKTANSNFGRVPNYHVDTAGWDVAVSGANGTLSVKADVPHGVTFDLTDPHQNQLCSELGNSLIQAGRVMSRACGSGSRMANEDLLKKAFPLERGGKLIWEQE